MNDKIAFDMPKLISFKRAYAKAIKAKREVFIFDNKEFYVPYAKLVIEYVEERLFV